MCFLENYEQLQLAPKMRLNFLESLQHTAPFYQMINSTGSSRRSSPVSIYSSSPNSPSSSSLSTASPQMTVKISPNTSSSLVSSTFPEKQKTALDSTTDDGRCKFLASTKQSRYFTTSFFHFSILLLSNVIVAFKIHAQKVCYSVKDVKKRRKQVLLCSIPIIDWISRYT